MLKIVHAELDVFAQSFFDELENADWGGDPPEHVPVPHGNQGVIQQDNFEDFEPAAADQPVEEELHRPVEPQEERPVDYHEEERLDAQMRNFDQGRHPEHAVEYNSGQKLVYDAIDNYDIIAFNYTDRFGRHTSRRVDPHYTFVAETTGNEVLVSFDEKKNDIRAFIVGNIHPYGVRYEGEKFKPKGEIMGENFEAFEDFEDFKDFTRGVY